jgi:hypothetical protein
MTPREWQVRRTQRCRLAPALALETTDDALAFLADRTMLTLTPSSALPSLFGACHEEPYAPGKGGYAQYPRTRWWWGGWLSHEPNVVTTKFARGRQLFLDRELAARIAPLPLRELGRVDAGELGPYAKALASLLAETGVATVDDVKAGLGWDAARLRRVRNAVERTGAVLSLSAREDINDAGGHRHTAELRRWDDVVPRLRSEGDADEALAELVAAAIHAAVIAPEKEVRTWFSWKVPASLVEQLVGEGRVQRVDNSLAAPH